MAGYLEFSILPGVRNSLRSDMRTPGRMEISIYHTHEFYKTIKKHDNDLYTARPCNVFGDTASSKRKVLVKSNLYYWLFWKRD